MAPYTDRLRLSAMGRGKSHLPGCAPARRAVYRRAAAAYNGQGAKAACRGVLRPAVPSGDRLRLSAMGRSKSHLLGLSPACCGIWRPAAALCDGRGQKPRGGMIYGLRHRLPSSCGVLRRAGAKATGRGVLRPAAPSGDRLRRPTTVRGKSGLPGCAPACRAVWRRAAAFCEG